MTTVIVCRVLFAIADAMKTEYRAIVEAGFLLQIADPQLVTRYDAADPPLSAAEYCEGAEVRVEALNHALADIPQDRVRYHICWGGSLSYGNRSRCFQATGSRHVLIRCWAMLAAAVLAPWGLY